MVAARKCFANAEKKQKMILVAKSWENLGVKIMGNFSTFETRGVQSRDSNSPHL